MRCNEDTAPFWETPTLPESNWKERADGWERHSAKQWDCHLQKASQS